MPSIPDRDSRVPQLIDRFSYYVSVFEQQPAFSRAGQLEHHLETIKLRRNLGTAIAALRSDEFLQCLYNTLLAWGIGVRASKLLPFPEFMVALRAHSVAIGELEQVHIDDSEINVLETIGKLWALVENLGIVENKSRIVPGTKALHHILPDLVVPVDRMYTQRFFRWHNPEFQYQQAGAFRYSVLAFVKIASKVQLSQFLNTEWNSSKSKIIDNAIVGLLLDEDAQGA
jgi:hypothetical protein